MNDAERREQIVQELTALLHEYKYDHCVQAVTIIAIHILRREATLQDGVERLRLELEDFVEVVELGQVKNPDPAFAEWLTSAYQTLGMQPTPPEELKETVESVEQAINELDRTGGIKPDLATP